MAKIVVWGFTSSRTEEQVSKLEELQIKYASLSLQIRKDKDEEVLRDCVVLIKHDLDIPKDRVFQWTVMCSGVITEPNIIEAEKTAGISPDTLVENLDDFLSLTEGKEVIEKQDIEALFSLDPKLEELLQPFASASPFINGDANRETLKEAKVKLKEYIDDYLSKQGRP